MRRDLTHVPAVVRVAGVCADGWFSATFTLAGFAKAREQLARVDILLVMIEGSLA